MAANRKNKKTVAPSATGGGKNKKKVKKSTAERKVNAGVKDGGKEKLSRRPTGLAAQILPFVFGVAAVFFAICLLADGVGIIGGGLRDLLLGLFSGAAYTIPLFLLACAFMWRADSENGMIPWKLLCYGISFVDISVMMHFFTSGPANFSVVEQYKSGLLVKGGGVVGGVLGELMLRGFGKALSLVILFALLFVFVLLMFGITPRGLWVLIAYKIKMSKERTEAARQEEFDKKEQQLRRRPAYAESGTARGEQLELSPAAQNASVFPRKKKNFDVDVNVEEDYEDNEPPAEPTSFEEDSTPVEEKIFEEVMRRTQDRLANSGTVDGSMEDLPWEESIPAERAPGDVMDEGRLGEMAEEELDLSRIFSEASDEELLRRLHLAHGDPDAGTDADTDIELSVQRRQLTETRSPAASAATAEPPAPPEYQFPPLDLLTADGGQSDENVAEELRENAARLVETLKNFNVRTKIVDVSRGPTITRYELLPEPGTRIRSIANLVDDIALNLATTGVRIEAPIPGKSAVGIEVPNKNAATVHLRTLIGNPRFASAKSRITAALGQDVGGADIYLDVAKMPHLLIAGATGMGKSVCINSLIVSLLYKAKPDELKLIMVDPKKVELNIYNGIPHLYMPVVSDPKKAAGALSWAVSEMERRYSLIEEVGVRDLKAYNEITKNDPQYEFLPQFVIIIDELADLMMTAKNDVEDSICRIAQKARAAGMHLIIGTQRPSVDVITGLIKANFPSRISFRVSSQIDSRTIIDRNGAETLVGRGDMLYNPVGAHEPIRVQGAFVSEEDVEKVVDFIKSHNGRAEYDRQAIEEVERNAASIGASKKSGGGEDGDGGLDDDPMLRPAIELAVESGKISTSLIQRRLSLGYGRAAKLIDRMEQLGYVSAPEGQKPRDVLITKEQFMEMVLRDTDS